MKKLFLILTIALFFVIPSIFATSDKPLFKIDLYSSEGTFSQVSLWNGNQVQFTGSRLDPNIDYTLVYTQDKMPPVVCTRYDNGCLIRPGPSSYSSQRYPRIKCILTNIKSDGEGNAGKSGKYNYLPIAQDNKDQKLMLVQSKDVRCSAGTFLHYNPTSYIVASNMI